MHTHVYIYIYIHTYIHIHIHSARRCPHGPTCSPGIPWYELFSPSLVVVICSIRFSLASTWKYEMVPNGAHHQDDTVAHSFSVRRGCGNARAALAGCTSSASELGWAREPRGARLCAKFSRRSRARLFPLACWIRGWLQGLESRRSYE